MAFYTRIKSLATCRRKERREMKALKLGAMATAFLSLALAGCGGGNSGGGGTTDVTRTLLDGGGAASGEGVTTKTWRIVAISGNHNYPAASGDQPCPVKLTDPNDSRQTLECGASDIVTISSDGTFKYQGWGKAWSLDGSQVTLEYGLALGTQVAEVVPESVGGKQRLRILQVRYTLRGEVDPHDDGSVLVLEEAAM